MSILRAPFTHLLGAAFILRRAPVRLDSCYDLGRIVLKVMQGLVAHLGDVGEKNLAHALMLDRPARTMTCFAPGTTWLNMLEFHFICVRSNTLRVGRTKVGPLATPYVLLVVTMRVRKEIWCSAGPWGATPTSGAQ